MNYQTITMQEAHERFDLYWINSPHPGDDWWDTDAAEIRLFEDDVHIPGDFKQEYLGGNADGVNIIVGGDLIVEGHCERDSDGTNFMLVAGSVKASAVSVAGGAYITVKGNLETDLLYGLNSEESRLWVAGDVNAGVIYSDYFMVEFDKSVQGLVFGSKEHVKAKNTDITFADEEASLHPGILDNHGDLDLKKALLFLEQGKDITN